MGFQNKNGCELWHFITIRRHRWKPIYEENAVTGEMQNLHFSRNIIRTIKPRMIRLESRHSVNKARQIRTKFYASKRNETAHTSIWKKLKNGLQRRWILKGWTELTASGWTPCLPLVNTATNFRVSAKCDISCKTEYEVHSKVPGLGQ
jgi:hypothetical protein